MAKKKTVPKSKKKPARPSKPSKKKTAPSKKAASSKKAAAKRKPSRGKTSGSGVLLEVAEVEVMEPEDVAGDEVFPPDYGGSE
jgi:hypothetical protein